MLSLLLVIAFSAGVALLAPRFTAPPKPRPARQTAPEIPENRPRYSDRANRWINDVLQAGGAIIIGLAAAFIYWISHDGDAELHAIALLNIVVIIPIAILWNYFSPRAQIERRTEFILRAAMVTAVILWLLGSVRL